MDTERKDEHLFGDRRSIVTAIDSKKKPGPEGDKSSGYNPLLDSGLEEDKHCVHNPSQVLGTRMGLGSSSVLNDR